MTRHGLLLALALMAPPAAAQSVASKLTVVAAENFYGDVAGQLAGPGAVVSSVLSNPDQDPHLFEASPSVARSLSVARVVIYNGADYDPWMATLLRAARAPERRVIVVAGLVGKKAGDNPHLWYDPANMEVAARALAAAFVAADPAGRAGYEQRLATFAEGLKPLQAKIAAMRATYAGTAVTATEPVFGYMATALGLVMRNERFQTAVMNGTEPRASDVAAFEGDLRKHLVRVFLYNSQATDPAAKRLLDIAKASGVPVVGVTETEPAGLSYQGWMMGQLESLDTALAKHAP